MDLKYYLSSPLPRLAQFSLWSQCGALAPCGDLEPVAGKDWATRLQLYFPPSPLQGVRGASLLRCPGGGGGGAPLVWQDAWAWKSLPAAQTHGIQMWLLLGPCILPELLCTWPLVCPNTEGCFYGRRVPLASLYGVMHKPECPAFLNCLKWNHTAKSVEL